MPQYISSYVHGDGKIGALVQLACRDHFTMRTDEFKALAHDLALQVAAQSPLSISAADLPANQWEAHLILHRAELDRLNGIDHRARIKEMREDFEREHCLLNQRFIKDTSMNIAALIERVSVQVRDSIFVARFVRYDANEI